MRERFRQSSAGGRSWLGVLSVPLAIFAAVALIAGGVRLAAGQDTGDEGDAAVRVIHGSSGAGAVDIYVDGDAVLEGIEFGAVSDPFFLPEGSYQIQIAAAGDDLADAVIDTNVDLLAGASYEIAAVGTAAELAAEVYEVDLADIADGRARARVIHGSPDAGPVDVALTGGDVLFAGVEFGDASDYLDLDAGTYDFDVRPAGTEEVALSLPGVALEAGGVYDLFAVGAVDDGTLQVLAVANLPEAQQVAGFPAAIATGSCDGPGEAVAPLNNLVDPEGDPVGQSDLATRAASSFTLVDLTLDDIITGEQIITIDLSEAETGTAIACGEIGGVLTENGNLAIGLREQNGSGYAGIAYFETDADTPDQTDVYVFLAPDLTGGLGEVIEVPASPVATEEPIVEEPVETPSPAIEPPTDDGTDNGGDDSGGEGDIPASPEATS